MVNLGLKGLTDMRKQGKMFLCSDPQGSILETVNFTLYTTPLIQNINKSISRHRYADDTLVDVLLPISNDPGE